MKIAKKSWWIGGIIGPILTLALVGTPNPDYGVLLFVGLSNGIFWGWILGLIIDSFRAKAEGSSSEISINTSEKKPHSEYKEIDPEAGKKEIAEILEEFSMDQDALEALKQINSNETEDYFVKFLELFKKEVYRKTGVRFPLVGETMMFKSFPFAFSARSVELSRGRGKLLFISNNLGNVFENHKGRTICSLKYIILGIEEGRLSRWLLMHLTGRIHEPRLFLLKEDDLVPCGALSDDSYDTLFHELDSRLEKTPSHQDWESFLDDFYNKI